MSKRTYNIRWRDSDVAEVERTIRNFNAKLYRLQKKNPELAEYLPARLKKGDVIASIHTRADFKRELNKYKRFSKKGAEAPIKTSRSAKTTKWEVAETKRDLSRLNQQNKKKLEKLKEKPPTSRGENIMGEVKVVDLEPKTLNIENKSQREWDLFKENVRAQLDPVWTEFEKHNFKLNYIKGLRNEGYSEDVVSLVMETPIDKFVEIATTDREADIDFIYDPIEFKLKQDTLLELWGKHAITK